MAKLVHLDISAADPERAARFYATAIGWSAQKLDGPEPYWLVATEPGDPTAVGAGIGRRAESWQSVTPTVGVDSADECARKVERAGGTILIPKTFVPGVGHLVTFRDTEGNVFAALEASAAGPPAG